MPAPVSWLLVCWYPGLYQFAAGQEGLAPSRDKSDIDCIPGYGTGIVLALLMPEKETHTTLPSYVSDLEA